MVTSHQYGTKTQLGAEQGAKQVVSIKARCIHGQRMRPDLKFSEGGGVRPHVAPQQLCASPVLFTFQTHHARHTVTANSNQMEHLEIIKSLCEIQKTT